MIRPITVVSSANCGAVCSCTVMCVQGVQEWAEDAALRCTSVEDQGRSSVVAHSDHLTSACQEVQDPAAQRSVQSQSLELRNQCGRHYGLLWFVILAWIPFRRNALLDLCTNKTCQLVISCCGLCELGQERRSVVVFLILFLSPALPTLDW